MHRLCTPWPKKMGYKYPVAETPMISRMLCDVVASETLHIFTDVNGER